MFTVDDYINLFTYLKDKSTKLEIDEVLVALSESERAKAQELFATSIDQVVHNTEDHKRLREFMIDWYATHKTITSLQRQTTDVYLLPEEQLNELLLSFGYNFLDQPLFSKQNFLLELITLYKGKGTPITFKRVLDFLGFSETDVVEYWLYALPRDWYGDEYKTLQGIYQFPFDDQSVNTQVEYVDSSHLITLSEIDPYDNINRFPADTLITYPPNWPDKTRAVIRFENDTSTLLYINDTDTTTVPEDFALVEDSTSFTVSVQFRRGAFPDYSTLVAQGFGQSTTTQNRFWLGVRSGGSQGGIYTARLGDSTGTWQTVHSCPNLTAETYQWMQLYWSFHQPDPGNPADTTSLFIVKNLTTGVERYRSETLGWSTPHALNQSTAPVFFGTWQDEFAEWFLSGYMANVIISNRQLTEDEIDELSLGKLHERPPDSFDLWFRSKTIDGSPSLFTWPDLEYDKIVDGDPHWLYTEAETKALVRANKLSVPTKSPYFTFRPNYRQSSYEGIIALVARIISDQYRSATMPVIVVNEELIVGDFIIGDTLIGVTSDASAFLKAVIYPDKLIIQPIVGTWQIGETVRNSGSTMTAPITDYWNTTEAYEEYVTSNRLIKTSEKEYVTPLELYTACVYSFHKFQYEDNSLTPIPDARALSRFEYYAGDIPVKESNYDAIIEEYRELIQRPEATDTLRANEVKLDNYNAYRAQFTSNAFYQSYGVVKLTPVEDSWFQDPFGPPDGGPWTDFVIGDIINQFSTTASGRIIDIYRKPTGAIDYFVIAKTDLIAFDTSESVTNLRNWNAFILESFETIPQNDQYFLANYGDAEAVLSALNPSLKLSIDLSFASDNGENVTLSLLLDFVNWVMTVVRFDFPNIAAIMMGGDLAFRGIFKILEFFKPLRARYIQGPTDFSYVVDNKLFESVIVEEEPVIKEYMYVYDRGTGDSLPHYANFDYYGSPILYRIKVFINPAEYHHFGAGFPVGGEIFNTITGRDVLYSILESDTPNYIVINWDSTTLILPGVWFLNQDTGSVFEVLSSELIVLNLLRYTPDPVYPHDTDFIVGDTVSAPLSGATATVTQVVEDPFSLVLNLDSTIPIYVSESIVCDRSGAIMVVGEITGINPNEPILQGPREVWDTGSFFDSGIVDDLDHVQINERYVPVDELYCKSTTVETPLVHDLFTNSTGSNVLLQNHTPTEYGTGWSAFPGFSNLHITTAGHVVDLGVDSLPAFYYAAGTASYNHKVSVITRGINSNGAVWILMRATDIVGELEFYAVRVVYNQPGQYLELSIVSRSQEEGGIDVERWSMNYDIFGFVNEVEAQLKSGNITIWVNSNFVATHNIAQYGDLVTGAGYAGFGISQDSGTYLTDGIFVDEFNSDSLDNPIHNRVILDSTSGAVIWAQQAAGWLNFDGGQLLDCSFMNDLVEITVNDGVVNPFGSFTYASQNPTPPTPYQNMYVISSFNGNSSNKLKDFRSGSLIDGDTTLYSDTNLISTKLNDQKINPYITSATSDNSYYYITDGILKNSAVLEKRDRSYNLIDSVVLTNSAGVYNTPFDIEVDNNLIYILYNNPLELHIYNKNTMSYLQSVSLGFIGSTTGRLLIDLNNDYYILSNSGSINRFHRFLKSDNVYQDLNTLVNVAGDLEGVSVDSSYFYIVRNNSMHRYNKNFTFSNTFTLPEFVNSYFKSTTHEDSNYVFIANVDELWAVHKTTGAMQVIGGRGNHSLGSYMNIENIKCNQNAVFTFDLALYKFELRDFDTFNVIESAWELEDYTPFVSSPFGLIEDASGNKYVSANYSSGVISAGAIVKYNANWDYVSSIIETETPGVYVGGMYGLATDNSFLYAVDTLNHVVYKINMSSMQVIDSFGQYGSFGSGTTNLFTPKSIVYDLTSGNLFITDSNNSRVVIISTSMTYVDSITSSDIPDIANPYGIAIDNNGHIYITNFGGNDLFKVRISDKTVVDQGVSPISAACAYLPDISKVLTHNLGPNNIYFDENNLSVATVSLTSWTELDSNTGSLGIIVSALSQ